MVLIELINLVVLLRRRFIRGHLACLGLAVSEVGSIGLWMLPNLGPKRTLLLENLLFLSSLLF